MKIKELVLILTILLFSPHTQGADKKVIPEKLRKILKEVGREDPFIPPKKEYITPSPEGRKSQLEGIIWSEDKPLAIINGEIVGEGQTVGDKKIIKIQKDSVIVEAQDGERYTIELH